jgi:signal transduction histidine kinase
VNLLTNAVKATGPKGKIAVTTTLTDKKNIKIDFKDSGHGIPGDIIARIFDPFFTTSPEGEGTGLGLSISYFIVQQMNGEISVDSTPGQGSTFTVNLPAADEMTDHRSETS